MKQLKLLAIFATTLSITSCNNSGEGGKGEDSTKKANVLQEENVRYNADSIMNGFIVYGDSIEGKRPGILVVHEWWGLDDYAKERTRQLAKMGYIAMAVDMFGGGKTAANPQEAMALAGPFYQDPQLAKNRLDAALAQLKSYEQTDTNKIAAIGYCYGGYVVLNAAKLGSDLNGVVSFHGGLGGAPPAKDALKAKILVCHGGSDPMVPQDEFNRFTKQMDSVNADYEIKVYPDATHAFTNPAASETGKKFNIPIAYNPDADRKSWNDMKAFLDNLFR
jgi:dienelactone hydrolase